MSTLGQVDIQNFTLLPATLVGERALVTGSFWPGSGR